VAALDPVVTGLAQQEVHAVAAEDEVVVDATPDLLAVRPCDQEALALVAEDEREAAAAVNDVVAFLAVQEVHLAGIGAGIGDDVITLAAVNMVNTVASL